MLPEDVTFDFLKSSAFLVSSGITNSYETRLNKITGRKIINAYLILSSPACRTVLNALKKLAAPEKEAPAELKDVELSPRLATARARAAQYEEDRVSGQMAKDLYQPDENPAQGFVDRYKLRLGERLENGYYREGNSDTSVPSVNSSKVGSGENDVSIDTSEFSRTGKDNRKGY